MMVAVIAITTLTITGILASTYTVQHANVQNQTSKSFVAAVTNFKEESFICC